MTDTTGIYRHHGGWRAVVRRGSERTPIIRQFPIDTPIAKMQAWRQQQQDRLRASRRSRAAAGTFRGDADRYLESVRALPTYADRVREIELWIAVFGDRPRDAISSAEIRAQRDRWLIEPRSDSDPRPVSPATVNKRLRALSNLWTVLDGPRAPNPVRDVPEAPERRPAPRMLTYADIERIVDAMADGAGGQWKGPRPRGRRPKWPSLAKVRVRILAETGLSLSTLKRIGSEDVDFTRRLLFVPPRRKGAGADGVVVPLTAGAATAFRELATLGGFGEFSSSRLRRAFQRACRLVGVRARLHDLRHAFLTGLAAASRDEGAVQAVGQHGDVRTTRRYIEGSVSPRVAAAMEAFERSRQVGTRSGTRRK